MDLEQQNKLSAKAYNNHKAMLKKILQGRVLDCPDCKKILTVAPIEGGFKVTCAKGCTDIELEANPIKP